MAAKTKLLECVEVSRKVAENIRLIYDNKVSEIVDRNMENIFAMAVAKHVREGDKYTFDEEYCDTYTYGDLDEKDIDEDRIITYEGNFNPLDYDSMLDFMDENSGDYDKEWDWGKYRFRTITVERELISLMENLMGDTKDVISNEINSLTREELISCISHVEQTIRTKKREKRLTIKTNKIKYSDVGKTVTNNIATSSSDYIKGLSDKDLLELITKDTLDYECLCSEYPESKELSDFKRIYKKGCELLGWECNEYQTIKYSGTDKERYIYAILKESFLAKNILNQKGIPATPLRIDKWKNSKCEMIEEKFEIENATAEIELSKEYIRNKVVSDSGVDKVDDLLKLLSAIYAYEEIEGASIEELDKIFEYKELKYSLLYCGIKKVVTELYPKCLIKEGIKKSLPSEPKNYYPIARNKFRKFILHIGPTNSGKTYESLEKLKTVSRGAYLAPLRLLALEVQEKMIKDGVKCNLVTGEEENIVDGAMHVCSTIEKLNYQEEYDLIVIDECQMLEDQSRGSAWTSAILGANSREIHICLAPYAKDMVIDLIDYCGDFYEIVEHTRDTELEVVNEHFDFRKDLQEGDALVTFSKRKVLNLAAAINTKTDKTCSVLFGALPYRSRKKQFENFSKGLSNILVTTDCIGLGVNLAIKRIIFMEDYKYDGKTNRQLTTSEILQISGRAGRKNIYDKGQVITASKPMLKSYSKEINPISKCYIGLTHHLLDIEGELEDIIYAWKQLDFGRSFEKADISNQIEILNSIKYIDLSKEQRYEAMFLPVNIKSDYEMELLRRYLRDISNGKATIGFPNMPQLEYDNKLKQLEDYSKAIDLYYSICKVFNLKLNSVRVEIEREKTCSKINGLLLSSKLETPKCNMCGEELSWDYDRYRCSGCYSGGYSYNRYDYDDYDDEDDEDDEFDLDFI